MSASQKHKPSPLASRALALLCAVFFALCCPVFAFAAPGEDETSSDLAVSDVESVGSAIPSDPSGEVSVSEPVSEPEQTSAPTPESKPVQASDPAPGTSSETQRNVGTAEIVAGLRRIMEKYPSDSYFTKNGKACKSHPRTTSNRCDNCKTATAEEAGTEGNIQCFGFARVVFYSMFGIPYPHLSNSVRWRVAGAEIGNVVQLWENAKGKSRSVSGVQKLFEKALIGDVIQSGLTHSMVFLGAADRGILVYDANFDLTHCQVLVHVMPWQQVAQWAGGYGMSLYRSANYDTSETTDPDGVLEGFIAEMLEIAAKYYTDDSALSNATDGTSSQYAGKRISSVSFPVKTDYIVGETFSPDGAEMVIVTETGATVTYTAESLAFSGFDTSAPGEYTVTMEADGLQSAAFTVTVSASEAASTDPAEPLRRRPDVAIMIAIAAVSAAILILLVLLRSRRKKG